MKLLRKTSEMEYDNSMIYLISACNLIELTDSQAYSATWEHNSFNVQLANFSISPLFKMGSYLGSLSLPFTIHQTHFVLYFVDAIN